MGIKSDFNYQTIPETYQEICRKRRNGGLEHLEILEESRASYTVKAEDYEDFIKEFRDSLTAVDERLESDEKTETWRGYSEEALSEVLPNAIYQLSIRAL